MLCATRPAIVATPASAVATALITGSKTVRIVVTALPNCSLMSPSVSLTCLSRPLGVIASARFIPPTLSSTTSASTAARSLSVPNLRICSCALVKA